MIDSEEALMLPARDPPVSRVCRRPWVERYRPSSFSDIIAHTDVLDTLHRLMDSEAMPHLLFYGTPGTGKTTVIHACAKYLFRDNLKGNVLELNASDDRGIDVIRNEIKEFASTTSMFSAASGFFGSVSSQVTKAGDTALKSEEDGGVKGEREYRGGNCGYKLVILDEADQMSSDAQSALRRVIERYTKNVRFCIICNHVNKIIPAIQSRCTRFRFPPVPKKAMMPRLAQIATTEGVKFTEEGLAAAFHLSGGDMRRCLNLMQACALAKDEISEDAVYEVSGSPHPKKVAELVVRIMQLDFTQAFEQTRAFLLSCGASTAELITETLPVVMRLGLPSECKWFASIKLASIESNIASGTNDAVALAAFVGVLHMVKESVAAEKPYSVFALASC